MSIQAIEPSVNYTRATKRTKYTTLYIIQSKYTQGQPWEDENTETTYSDAVRSLREYRENSYGTGVYRLISRRVLNEQGE